MKLSNAQNLQVYDSTQGTVLYHLQNVKLSEDSFNRFGDKNRITKSLRALYLTKKGGYPLDKFVKNYLQDLRNLAEKDKIELVIDTMVQYDSRAKIDQFFKSTKPEKYVKPVLKDIDLNKAKPCLVKASLQHMSRQELRVELNDLIKSPSSYFGKLLEVNECKNDLFTVNDKQQIELAKKMLAQLDREEKPKISVGKQRHLKSQSKPNTPMASKKPMGKAAPKKKSSVTPKKRVIKSAKVKKINKIFAEIPEMIVKKAYEAGKKGTIKPNHKKLWHDSYRELKK